MHTKSAILLILSALCFALPACSVRALHEACDIVTTADSLRAAGQAYADSAHLAKAYTTLGRWRWFYPDEYAHSCYYYGRLLREKENPVAAMKCFIAATHSRTHDYDLLGRVYSNMGGMCQMEGSYSLAYALYNTSSQMFLENGDTVLYCFGRNNMAFVLAEEGKKDSVFLLLQTIPSQPLVPTLEVAMTETKMETYLKVQQYDSALYYANYLWDKGYQIESVLMIKAQVFSFMEENDSAAYYATKVISETTNLFLLTNAYYILTNQDDSKDISSVREASCKRADLQKMIEIRQGKLSHAVQLLYFDINRKTKWWLYCFIIISLAICCGIYWNRKQAMKKHVEKIIDNQIDSVAQSIKQHIDVNDIDRTLHWKSYPLMKSDADLYMGGIARKLESYKLNETEVRFCILTLLDFSQKQIADTIFYSYPSGIKTLKKRISVKLGTDPQKLKKYLLNMLTEP